MNPITIYQYPSLLFRIETAIDSLRAELAQLKDKKKSIESQAAKKVADDDFHQVGNKVIRKYKNEKTRSEAVLALCFQHSDYSELLEQICLKKLKLDVLRTKHALRRREHRILETEFHSSGLEYLPNCVIEEDGEN